MKSYRVYLDGNSWCAVDGNFVDLQQSLAGFGDTPLIALGELLLLEIAQYVADVGQAAQVTPPAADKLDRLQAELAAVAKQEPKNVD